MRLISCQKEADQACQQLARSRFIALDTEFLRDKTYWPQLCLVQIAGQNLTVALDPVAEPGVTKPLAKLLANTKVLKVLHGARQDLEIFHHLHGKLPHPLFDTQLAAMALGLGDQPGYSRLAQQLVGAHVSKEERFTDWARRPLTPEQLEYAESDVVPLRTLYEKLNARLQDAQRAEWIADELAALCDPEEYELKPSDAWKRFTLRQRKQPYLAVLTELAEWREREAQRRNLPRRSVLADEMVQELALRRPTNRSQLERIRPVRGRHRCPQETLETLCRRIARVLEELPERKLPPELNAEPSRRKSRAPADDQNARNETHDAQRAPPGLLAMLKALLKERAQELGVAPRLIANAERLENFAAETGGQELLTGWRYEAFGRDAQALRKGRLGFVWRNGALNLVENDRAQAAPAAKRNKPNGARKTLTKPPDRAPKSKQSAANTKRKMASPTGFEPVLPA